MCHSVLSMAEQSMAKRRTCGSSRRTLRPTPASACTRPGACSPASGPCATGTSRTRAASPCVSARGTAAPLRTVDSKILVKVSKVICLGPKSGVQACNLDAVKLGTTLHAGHASTPGTVAPLRIQRTRINWCSYGHHLLGSHTMVHALWLPLRLSPRLAPIHGAGDTIDAMRMEAGMLHAPVSGSH